MINSISITNNLGDTIKMELRRPELSGFLIQSITGLEPAKATINTTELATYDGGLYNSARLDQRNIVVSIVFVDNVNGETIEDLRLKCYKYFPVKQPVEILVDTDKYKLKTTGYIESNEPSIFSKQESTQISIICPFPYFYLINTEDFVETSFFGIEPNFEFPFSNEPITDSAIEFGLIDNVADGVITYNGDADVGFEINLHAIGEVTNPTIYNMKTKESMKIDSTKMATLIGSGIIAKDDIVIDTLKGFKSATLIRDGVFYNILNCIDKNADWFTLSRGDNIFAVSADSGITNLIVTTKNRVLYSGV